MHWKIHDLRTGDKIVLEAETSEQALSEYLETVVQNLLISKAEHFEVIEWADSGDEP